MGLRDLGGAVWRQRLLVLLVLLVVALATGVGWWLSPQSSGAPDLLLVVLLAGGSGLLLAIVTAVSRDARTRTVDGGAGVEAATSAPLLAHLHAPLDPAALPALEPGTAGAAAFSGLVAALASLASLAPGAPGAPGHPRGRVDRLVVAGVGGGEAPAWIAANLGVALAGRCPTLLVDARLGSRFGRPGPGEPDTAGLHEVLLGGALDDAVSPGPVRGLSVLPSGGWGLEPPPGLVAERFAAVADGARERFRGVVVIAPPLDSSDDGRLMASGAGLLLVVPEQRLVAGELRAHADRVRAAGGRLVGVVLVAAPLVAA